MYGIKVCKNSLCVCVVRIKYEKSIVDTALNTVFTPVICAIFPSLAAEKAGCVKYADFFCAGLDLGFILV